MLPQQYPFEGHEWRDIMNNHSLHAHDLLQSLYVRVFQQKDS